MKVKVVHILLKTVHVTTELRQGAAISTILFKLALEIVVKKATIDR